MPTILSAATRPITLRTSSSAQSRAALRGPLPRESHGRRSALSLAVALAFSTAGQSALAQTSVTPKEGDAPSTALTLGDVVVRARPGALSPLRVYTSVDLLPSERIADQPVFNTWELFSVVPGAQITQFNQGATSGKFSMRGFNGEGEINAVKLLIDGIPSNSNDGNMPYIDVAPRLDIQTIEVVRGTNDPRYGLHNIAGNANIVTRFGGNYAEGRAGLGSFGGRELQAAAGFERGGFSQNYAISRQLTDGWRAHSASDSTAFSGKWFYSPDGGGTRIGLIARRYDANAQEAGYLTAAERSANPSQSPAHNATDQDRRIATQLAVQAETALGNGLHAAGQVYVNDLDDRRYVRFSAGASQQERYVAERHVGASTSLTWRAGKTALGDLTLTGGVDAELQDNRSERYNTAAQVRTAQTRNQQFDFNVAGAFVQAMVKPIEPLTVVAAYRVDRITGSYVNLLNNTTYAVNDYGVVGQPKLSAIYALDPSMSVYGNWGRSFQVGVGTASYRVNQTSDLAPSVNDGMEAGLKFRIDSRFDGRVAVWRQTASNEARRKLNDPANDAENIGETRREGIDLQINAKLGPRLSAWSALGLQRSKILKADAASANTEGKEIDHVPKLVYNFGAQWQATDALKLAGWATGQSAYYLERTNGTGRFGKAFTLNASAAYAVSRQVQIELQLRNITNQYNEYVWWDGAQSLHAPGAPRSVFASVALSH